VGEVLAAPSGPVRLLLVDDDPQVRSMTSEMLEAGGYVVRQAADGQAAIEAARLECPDLVITDIVMPGSEGLETIQQLRRIRSDLPIVAVSGAMSGAYLKAARKLGADAVILKPFDAETLLGEVRRLTRGEGAAASEGGRLEQLSDRAL
jgi:DNA-binding response OmpR family regulator